MHSNGYREDTYPEVAGTTGAVGRIYGSRDQKINGVRAPDLNNNHHAQGCMEFIAGKMFSSWSQENFFQYMMQNYDIDKLTEFGIEEVDPEKSVVNPTYHKNEYCQKKLREKQARVKARFFNIVEENMDKSIDDLRGVLENESKLQNCLKMISCPVLKKGKASPPIF